MAQIFNGSFKVEAAGTLSDSPDIGNSNYSLDYIQYFPIVNGTGAGQANMTWTDTRTISASSSENLDLAGVLTNSFGTTLTFTKIKGMIVTANSANTNNVLVGGAASNAFINWVADATDIIQLPPNAVFSFFNPAGYAVTAATGDLLKIANSSSGTPVTYDIVLIGCV